MMDLKTLAEFELLKELYLYLVERNCPAITEAGIEVMVDNVAAQCGLQHAARSVKTICINRLRAQTENQEGALNV